MSGDDAADVPARVIESFGRRVTVATPDGTSLPAELFGKRLTCVCGDEVTIRPPSRASGDVAKVVTVAPRRTTFARTDSRGRTEPLAANLSLLALIVGSYIALLCWCYDINRTCGENDSSRSDRARRMRVVNLVSGAGFVAVYA